MDLASNLLCFQILFVISSCSGLEVTSVTLLREDTEVNYVDASVDAPEQSLEFRFSLNKGEEFELAEIHLNDNAATSIEADGNTEYYPPFSEQNSSLDVSLNETYGIGNLLLLVPSLAFKGNYLVSVTTKGGQQDQRTVNTLGFKKCEDGWRVRQNLDELNCQVTFSSACESNSVYPVPYIAEIGLLSDTLENYVPETSAVFDIEEADDDSTTLTVSSSQVNYTVGDFSPKLLSLSARILHGAEVLTPEEFEALEDDDSSVLDSFVDAGRYKSFDTEGCPDFTAYCEDPLNEVQPVLPLGISLHQDLVCVLPHPDDYEFVQSNCRSRDIKPVESVNKIKISFKCAVDCKMKYEGINNGPVYKNISCQTGALQWEEDLRTQEDDLIEGLWPSCDCSLRDEKLASIGSKPDASFIIHATLAFFVAVKSVTLFQ